MNKAVFLDRDGTLIVDKAYMYRLEDFELIDGVALALKTLKEMGFLLIIITNQSGIGRGYYTLDEAYQFSDFVLKQLADMHCAIDAVYMCPHAPEEHCCCRKPSPFLIQKAILEWNILAEESYMFGDKDIDIECGNNAGVKAFKVTKEKNLLYWVNKMRTMIFDSDKFKDKKILVLGDIMIDIYTIGTVNRISPEAPIPVLKVKSIYETLGGSANVANNIASLGAKPYVIGLTGNDEASKRLHGLLKNKGIEGVLVESNARPTTTKNRIVSNNQQMLRIDSEVDSYVSNTQEDELLIEAIKNLLPQMDVLVISDYAKGVCSYEVCQYAIKQAVYFHIPVIIDPKGKDWARYNGATIVTPNLRELSDIVGRNLTNEHVSICQYGPEIIDKYNIKSLVITRSERGMSYVEADCMYELPTEAREVADVSGAGDTVVATLATCLAAGFEMKDALRIANKAAGLVVAKAGTQPIMIAELDCAYHISQNQKMITQEELPALVQQLRANGKKVVFTNGCFDILHVGHITYLQQAKAKGDVLMIGLNSDDSVRRLKGPERPINNENDRAALLAALGCVDYVIIFSEDTPYNLLSIVQPDILVKGGDYKKEEVVGREFAQSVEILPFVNGYSTTNTISKMKQ